MAPDPRLGLLLGCLLLHALLHPSGDIGMPVSAQSLQARLRDDTGAFGNSSAGVAAVGSSFKHQASNLHI